MLGSGALLGGVVGAGLLGVGGLVARALCKGYKPWMGWAALGLVKLLFNKGTFY